MGANTSQPTVGVVVPTRDRPELLRRTLESIRTQDYSGDIKTVVVYDRSTVDTSLEVPDGPRPVRVTSNARTPGLAGSRNTGVELLSTPFVAFCDDDDYWSASKIRHQVDRASQPDSPELVTCAITVDFENRQTPRLAGTEAVTHRDLLRSRMSMLHSSTLMFDRDRLLDGIGLVNEEIPGSQNEDWDLLLRAATRKDIAHIDEPLVTVQWGRTSMFARRWDTKITSLEWMLEHHPALMSDRKGISRVYGQLAFGEAARGHRRVTLRWSLKSLTSHPLQWRAGAAMLVASRAVSAETVLNFLHRYGRGV